MLSIDSSSSSSGCSITFLWQIPQNPDMKCSRHSFSVPHIPGIRTLCVAIGLGLCLITPAESAAGQPPANSDSPDRQTTADPPADAAASSGADSSADAGAAADPPADADADSVLRQVTERLDGLDSLSCDLHQTVSFSGMQVVAGGRYVQATGNRFRLEFRLFPASPARPGDAIPASPDGVADAETADGGDSDRAAGATSKTDKSEATVRGVLTQVSDGAVLHTYFRNGEEVSVTRRNLRDITAAAEESAAYDRTSALHDLGAGGIKALIARIRNDMEFAPVSTRTDGSTRLLVVTGRWTADAKKRLFDVEDDVEILPAEHIPEYARLLIDAESLLPRRIQYLKRGATAEKKQVRPIVTLDFRRIELNRAVSDETFTFSPPEGVAEEDVTEQTIELIRQLGQAPAEGPIPPAAGGSLPRD